MAVALMIVFILMGTIYLSYQIHSINQEADEKSDDEIQRKIYMDNLFFNIFTTGTIILAICIGFLM